MRSYRLARRSFLAAVGGAMGLKAILTHMEAAAQGAGSPPRFLLTHFPTGTLRHRFLPEGTGADYVASPLIQPFEDAGLRGDMTVFYGFSDQHLRCPGGGSHEAGHPFTTTACSSEGTRENGGEHDDAVAGGPSFDQVFLKNVRQLARDGAGYANAICDARIASHETSTRCLSYGYQTRSIASAIPGGDITEYMPLLPELSPAKLYAELFSSFSPGGTNDASREEALRALRLRKSVLDYSLAELKELERLAPGSERFKIDMHAEAIRKVERQLSAQLESGIIEGIGQCSLPAEPAGDLIGRDGMQELPFTLESDTDDSVIHQVVAEAHLAIILAAFQCDIIRVATFQFCPGSNHVAFKGLWPGNPERIVVHHAATSRGSFLGSASDDNPMYLPVSDQENYEFLVNVQSWYNQRLADFLVKMKNAEDGFGGSLLDHTVIPYVTEVASTNHGRSPKPAYLFGGGALGLQHGTFQRFERDIRPQADLYLTCAQALLQTDDPQGGLTGERFQEFNPESSAFTELWKA